MLALAIPGGGLGDTTDVIAESDVWLASGFAPDSSRNPSSRSTAYLIASARILKSAHARAEAVERLGRQGDARALGALIAIARVDPDERVQQEAVEALGRLGDARAFPLLVEFARHHPVPDVRREAVEALGKLEGPGALAVVLARLALEGTDTELQREAVEALGQRNDPAALERLAHVARVHPSVDVRRTAIDEYAEAAAPDAALSFLRDVLACDRSREAQAEALDELEDLPDGLGVPTLANVARAHPVRALRAKAQRELRDHGQPHID